MGAYPWGLLAGLTRETFNYENTIVFLMILQASEKYIAFEWLDIRVFGGGKNKGYKTSDGFETLNLCFSPTSVWWCM